ncbi:MAG: hypothetical protein ACTSQS_01100 [Promethearchaeota archaeon]
MDLQRKVKSQNILEGHLENKNIHKFFIFNKSGICLYSRNFTDKYQAEENLLSSFFFAIMAFSKEIIGDKVRIIEIGNVKFVIVEKKLFYYGILCESMENSTYLEEIVSKIHKKFIEFIKNNNIDINIENFSDDDFNAYIDTILTENFNNDYDIIKETKIIEYLDELSYNDELEGIILLTDTGNVIYSSLEPPKLKEFLKEVDFRVKICNNSILKLFYTSKNNHLIFSEYVCDIYFVILIFDKNTKFGIAEYYLHKVVKFIENVIEDINLHSIEYEK